MAIDTRSRIRLGWVAAALAPLVTVQAMRLLMSPGPQAAAAAAPAAETPGSNPTAQPAAPAALTDEQQRAIQWLAEIEAREATVRSPMNVPEPPVSTTPAPVMPANEPAMPKLRLGGVVSRGADSVASINSRLFAVGDEPAEGWTIQAIDGAKRAVRLQRIDGKRIELTSGGMVVLTDGE